MATDIEWEGLNDSRGIFVDISWKAVPVVTSTFVTNHRQFSTYYIPFSVFSTIFLYFCLLFFFFSRVEIVMVESFISFP